MDEYQKLREGWFPTFYPRRIITPNGYHNPKDWANDALDCILHVEFNQRRDIPCSYEATNVAALISNTLKFNVPTYFLDEEFCNAIRRTEAPDFPLSEFKWPIESMVLMLPKEFSQRVFGCDIPFIELGKLGADMILRCNISCVGSKVTQIVGSIDISQTVNQLKKMASESEMRGDVEDLVFMEGEKSAEKTQLITSFVINFLAIMNARPNYAETEEALARPATNRNNPKKNKDALWHPRFIGRGYRPPNCDLGGTHASPRMHWRRGHFRRQHFGNNYSQMRVIWIEPVLVNELLVAD